MPTKRHLGLHQRCAVLQASVIPVEDSARSLQVVETGRRVEPICVLNARLKARAVPTDAPMERSRSMPPWEETPPSPTISGHCNPRRCEPGPAEVASTRPHLRRRDEAHFRSAKAESPPYGEAHEGGCVRENAADSFADQISRRLTTAATPGEHRAGIVAAAKELNGRTNKGFIRVNGGATNPRILRFGEQPVGALHRPTGCTGFT